MGARRELCQPRTQTGRLLRALLQNRTCALYEQSSQIRVTTFADAEQLLLAAGGVLARNDPHPSCELPSLMEGRSVADRRDECGGRDWSDARDGHHPFAAFVFPTGLLAQPI